MHDLRMTFSQVWYQARINCRSAATSSAYRVFCMEPSFFAGCIPEFCREQCGSVDSAAMHALADPESGRWGSKVGLSTCVDDGTP